MPITIDGTGNITGLVAGGLPDLSVTNADLAANAVSTSKLLDSAVTTAKLGSNEQAGLAKAWVNFNGTTASPSTIRASYNVSSVTKNGTGDYTVNFTTAMVDVNFTLVAIANGFSSFEDNNAVRTSTRTTSSIAVRSINGAATANVDSAAFQVAIFR